MIFLAVIYSFSDGSQGKYRRMGETGDRDVGSELVELITKVNENADIPAAVEDLANKLTDQLSAYEDQIINIISEW